MALLIGVLLALAVGVSATRTGLDRERGFYTTVTIVIAGLYGLFAVMGGSYQALMIESLVGVVFVVVAIVGFRSSLWLVVAALLLHGLFDFARGAAINNPGVPPWWPHFCLTYDVTAAAYLAWLLQSKRLRAKA
jgi:hypothetical protein